MITKPKVQKIRIRKWLDGIGGGTPTFNVPARMPQLILTAIYGHASLQPDEEALLVNYRADSDWCLLTTKRFVWFQTAELHSLCWSEITGAQQPPQKAAQIIRGELRKDHITELEVFDALGRKSLLHLEPGKAYYIIWSAILAFCNYVRRPDPISL